MQLLRRVLEMVTPVIPPEMRQEPFMSSLVAMPERIPAPNDYITCGVCLCEEPRHDWRERYRSKTCHGRPSDKLCARCRDLLCNWDGWTEESLARKIESPTTLANVFLYSNTRRVAHNNRLRNTRASNIIKPRKGYNYHKRLCIKKLLSIRPDAPIKARNTSTKKGSK